MIWYHSADGRFDQPIAAGEHPRLSPSGRYLAFQRGSNQDGHGNLYVRDLQTGADVQVWTTGSDWLIGYDWIDDTWLIQDYSCGIYRTKRDGTTSSPVPNGNCWDDAPVVDHVNNRFANHNTNGGGILVSGLDGSNRRLVPNTNQNDVWPAWSLDGQWISYNDGKNLFKIHPDGTGQIALTALTATGDALGVGAWASDGQHILAAGTVNGVAGVYSVATDGSKTITPVPIALGPAPDWVGWIGSLPDADGDGVPDIMDTCPGTPPGTPVNAAGCPANTCAGPVTGLVSWYMAEGDATDATGANPGALKNGAGFAPGAVGQAFQFNGTNQYVQVNDSASLHPTSLTAEGWFLFRGIGGITSLIGKPVGTVFQDSFTLWYENGSLRGTVDTATSSGDYCGIPWVPQMNQWYHLAYTYDATLKTQSLYINGVRAITTPATRPPAYDSHPMLIGADIDNENYGYYLNGMADEVAIYNRALSDAEIRDIYAAGAVGKCTSLTPDIVGPLPEILAGTAPALSLIGYRGVAPYTFSIASGALPAGLTLSSTGRLNGTTQATGTYTVTVHVSDSAGHAADRAVPLTVVACAPIPAGVIAGYRAEGSAADIQGHYPGTIHPATSFVPGRVGQAFAFDGGTGYVSIPDAPGLRPASLTISAWISFNAVGAVMTVVGKEVGTAFLDSYGLWYEGGGLHGIMGNASAYDIVSYPWAPQPGRWYHVAYTYDSVNKQHALYVDGAQVASSTTAQTIGYEPYPVTIGADTQYNSPALFWNGKIDDVFLFGRALSAAEIKQVYDAGSAGFCGPNTDAIRLLKMAAGLLPSASADITAWDKDGDNHLTLRDVVRLMHP